MSRPRLTLPSRRLVLGSAAAGAAAALAAGCRAPSLGSAPVFRNDPFSLGVASGDPASDGFVLWTRLAPNPLDPDGGLAVSSHKVVHPG